MTLEEAIERLEQRVKGEFYDTDPENTDDMKMGIEALKHCQDIHHMSYEDLHILLPGETTE